MSTESPWTEIQSLTLKGSLDDFDFSNKIVGKGAFGAVSLAKRISTGKVYAVKSCPKSLKNDPYHEYDVVNELKLHHSLRHKYIIRFYGYLDDGMSILMVMEFAEGGDLSNHLKANKANDNFTARVLYQSSSGLKYLHNKKIIHRDLKPANLLLDGKLNIRLADFGLSVANLSGTRSTQCGTIHYMAPELFNPRPKYNESVDLWSLGVIAYEVTSKKLPFTGYTDPQLKHEIQRGYVQKPCHVNPLLWNMIEKLLVINSGERLCVDDVIGHEFVLLQTRKESDDKQNESDVKQSVTGHRREEIHASTLIDEEITENNSDEKPEKDTTDENISLTVSLAHKEGLKVISGFNTINDFYKSISSSFDISTESISFLTINTDKVDMSCLFEGRLKTTDVVFVHVKDKKQKSVTFLKSQSRMGISLSDNGICGTVVKTISRGSLLKECDLIESLNGQSVKGLTVFQVGQVSFSLLCNTVFLMMLLCTEIGSTITLYVTKPKKRGKASELIRRLIGRQRTPKEKVNIAFKGNGTLIKLENEKDEKGIDTINMIMSQCCLVDNRQIADSIWDTIKYETTQNGIIEMVKATMGPVDLPEQYIDQMLKLTTREAATHDPNYQTLAGDGECFGADKQTKPAAGGGGGGPKAPAAGGMAGTHDPNYQTLAGVGGDCFEKDKKPAAGGGGPKAPAAGGMAGTHDPNYQTLAGVGGDCFDNKDKKPAVGGGSLKPGAGGVAATHDPNYQTLAGIGGNERFGADKEKKGPKVTGNQAAKTGTRDSNYQTLAGIGGNECFRADKEKKGPKVPGNQAAKASSHDSNYQTLAGIGGNECFGKNKKK